MPLPNISFNDYKYEVRGNKAVILADDIVIGYSIIVNGQYHCKDEPAVLSTDGFQYWYIEDKLHREDGHAIIGPRGFGYGWYCYGNYAGNSKEEFEAYKERFNNLKSFW